MPAPQGFGRAGVAFTDYMYYANLAAGATYTPTAKSLSTLFQGSLFLLRGVYIHPEFYDGVGWNDAVIAAGAIDTCSLNQDSAQSVRVVNGAAGAYKIILTGVTWATPHEPLPRRYIFKGEEYIMLDQDSGNGFVGIESRKLLLKMKDLFSEEALTELADKVPMSLAALKEMAFKAFMKSDIAGKDIMGWKQHQTILKDEGYDV